MGNPVLKAVSSSKQWTSSEAKKTKHSWDFKVSEPPWHEHVLLNSQSRQITVERRWIQRVDPTTDSRREQSETRGGQSQETGSVL